MKSSISQAVVLCGGFGTRLGSISEKIPKSLIPIHGIPLLDRISEFLREHGIDHLLMAAGYKSEMLQSQVESRSSYGMKVDFFVESTPLGTAGSLPGMREHLHDNFLLVYGDIFLDFDLSLLLNEHLKYLPLGTLLVRQSDHPHDSHLVVTNEDHRITEFITKQDPHKLYLNQANAAIYVLSKRILDFIPASGKSDFGKDVFPQVLSNDGLLRAHSLEPGGYLKDVGTPERIHIVEKHLKWKDQAAQARSKRTRIETVFLDRDGVINRESGLIFRPDQIELLPGVTEAIRRLNNENIKTVIVTNQPVIARGLCTEDTLGKIHTRITDELKSFGAFVDAIYYCPHHPETHHGEGVLHLRRACECRKPGIGLIMQACEELNLNLPGSVIVGNSFADIQAGHSAGIRTILVGDGLTKKGFNAWRACAHAPDLAGAVDLILSGKMAAL